MCSNKMVSVRWPWALPVPRSDFCSVLRPSRLSEPTSRYVVPGVSSGRVPLGSASTLSIFDQAQIGTRMRNSSQARSSARMPRIHHLRRLPGRRGFFGDAAGLEAGRVGGGEPASAGVANRGPSSGRRGGGASYVPPKDVGFSSGGDGGSERWSGPPTPHTWVRSGPSSDGRSICCVASGSPDGGDGGGDPPLPEYSQPYSGPSGRLSSAMAV